MSWAVCLVTQSCLTLCDPMECSPPDFSVHEDSPGRNTGVGCNGLLHGIFPIQGSNPSLLHCRQIIYHLSHQGSSRILEWVAYPLSRWSSGPCNQNRVFLHCRHILYQLSKILLFSFFLFFFFASCNVQREMLEETCVRATFRNERLNLDNWSEE